MAPKAPKSQPKAPEQAKQYPTIAAKLEAEYLASRPYQVLKDAKGLSGMKTAEKTAYANYRFLETGAWKSWTAAQQKEFWKAVQDQKIPTPLPKPQDLGKDNRGRDLGTYTPEEYKQYEQKERELRILKAESRRFRERTSGETLLHKVTEGESTKIRTPSEDIEVERKRRQRIGELQGKKMGKYEDDPEWDDVVPIPQDDGAGALAAIAYTDEYAEAMGYLRAVMAAKEYSPRVLELTEHIISMNAAHYTVWLYRASTIFALSFPVDQEIKWMNEVALDNQKNYQIWHHRQLLINHIYPSISSNPTALQALAVSEIAFMNEMFAEDSKNYHVWSYRQYLVEKLNLFNDSELKSVEALLRTDVRNNSAWSHRFFVVFSDPAYCTKDSKATEHDPQIPDAILDREIEYSKAATFEAPQNQSPWNYLRGVLKKGGRKLSPLKTFASEFVKIPETGDEEIRSSHALEFMADVWTEEDDLEKAYLAFTMLAVKYDPIRKEYWEWRSEWLEPQSVHNTA